VVGDFRSDRIQMPSVDDDRVFYYLLWQPPPPPRPLPAGVTAPPAVQVDTGGSYGFISLIVRLASPTQAPVALDVARSFDPELSVAVEMVDDAYASQNADTNLVSQVVGGFSVLAFLVAMAGIYGLMAFLVSGRRREIGVRMALGADAADIRRLILSSSLRLVVIGATIGTLGALGASRWIESEMFGLSSTDPATYAAVAVVVTVTAMLATWQPARQAARVDPAVTLRAE
jgi:ABC-type antimicrobial peptide transport system permease subunit